MSSIDAIQYHDRYTTAWNDRDAAGVMAVFADGGTVYDPATDGPLSGEEIGEWVEETTKGFPDVRFEIDRRVSNENGEIFVEWTMYGTHDRPFSPISPTGKAVEISGVDVISTSNEGITAIDGYFDTGEFKKELGLTFPAVIFQLPTLVASGVRNL